MVATATVERTASGVFGGVEPDAAWRDEVLRLATSRRVSMRTAAYMLAIGRVATAHRLRGVYA